jgi:hypothetical protein
MKQRLFIFLSLLLLIGLLVGLNAASYTQKPETPDSENYPNRSTYNAGATGTRAFFELLAETGRKPVRWREKPSALLTNPANAPQTFVVIGEVRREFTDEEIDRLLEWVSQGGKLVVIDRSPHKDLISTTANWQISTVSPQISTYGIDPSDQQQMILKTNAAKPVLPTVFTQGVNAVQPSKFSSSIKFEVFSPDEAAQTKHKLTQTPNYEDDYYDEESERNAGTAEDKAASDKSEPVIIQSQPTPAPKTETAAPTAPVIHLANNEKSLLADFPYGAGQIVLLTDPYIVSNAGIGLVDNAQLAINIVASRGGTIAFDEYHQGFGANENRILAYFADTPVPAIFLQIILLIGVILFTQSRRFARPLPANELNRLSKLEYVSAMAELQQRTRAYDLAIENIYTEFRRRAARVFGVDNFVVSHAELAQLIAERTKLNADEIENLLRKCEAIVQGEPTNKREVLEITARLREIEEKLGMKRMRKQAFRK